jgi:Na+-translocating ferredoxin:NAD+ oxidoreductase RnfD subunit
VIDRRNAALRRFAISISALTIAGAVWLGFEDSWLQPCVALATAYTLELVLETLDAWSARRPARYRGGRSAFLHSLLPAHITALSIALLLYPNARLWPIVFATTVAISSKFVIRIRVGDGYRHFLNPSNLGISVTLLAFSWVGISPPYQFTEYVTGAGDWIVPALVLAAGTMLNAKLTGKMPLILAWVCGFGAQAWLRSALFGTSLVSALLPMTGLVFVLYTNYMITDPGTSPVARRGQIVFGATTAAAYGVLVAFHIVFGMFFGLTLVTMFRGGVLVAARRATRPRVSALSPARVAP